MAALKLFISHSSRLDDVDHGLTSDNHNWELLKDTCTALKDEYGDNVEVLVDFDGLTPGEDWNRQLNLWLSECQAALIIFSDRAINKSDWVAKEVSILSWRADLDSNMTLIPVTLKDQSNPEQLAEDFLGTLRIDTQQCIRDAKTANDIVKGFKEKFDPETLAAQCPDTPFEILQAGIAERLTDDTTLASIKASLTLLGCPVPNLANHDKVKYAALLAREFLSPGPNQNCFNVFQLGLDSLMPEPTLGNASYLYKMIRSLWVNANAAAHLPNSQQHRYPLLMTGDLVDHSDEELGTVCYTLQRTIERAWQSSALYKIVLVTDSLDEETLKIRIRESFFKVVPPSMTSELLDRTINNNPTRLILFIKSTEDNGGLPDSRKIKTIQALFNTYKNLIIIFSILSPTTEISTLKLVSPTYDFQDEQLAYSHEVIAHDFLKQKYTNQL